MTLYTTGAAQFFRCAFQDAPFGVYSGGGLHTASHCIFERLGQGLIHGSWIATNNVFVDCTWGILNGTGILNQWVSNVFLNCVRDIELAVSASYLTYYVIDNNSHYGWSSALGRYASTDYTSLAAWQVATGKEAASLSSNPLLVDAGKRLYLARSDSPLVGTGRNGATIGLGIGEAISSNRNATLLTGGIFTGTVLNVFNNVEQSVPGVNGTYSTDVLDLGQPRNIQSFHDTAAEPSPNDLLDHSTADTAPSRRTLEARYSSTPFLVGDPSPSWAPYERNLAMGSPLRARYWQFRYVLRSDGVTA